MILPAALVVLSVLQPPPFADLQPQPQVQSFLRADVLRRSRELTSLGWVGRAWLVAPFVVDRLLPDGKSIPDGRPLGNQIPGVVLLSILGKLTLGGRVGPRWAAGVYLLLGGLIWAAPTSTIPTSMTSEMC